MSDAIEKAWRELTAPQNETVTSKWYFRKGYEAGQASTFLPEDERIELAAHKDSASFRNDNKEKYCTNKDFVEARMNAFIRGANYVRESIKKRLGAV
jgi:hypothetical protein